MFMKMLNFVNMLREITDEIIKSAGGAGSKFGTGGMLSKIKSAQMIFDNNSQMILMNGANPRDILCALEGANLERGFHNLSNKGGLEMGYIDELWKNAKITSQSLVKLEQQRKIES